jgi:hypothetical protein
LLAWRKIMLTAQSLFDRSGNRKYLTPRERLAFVKAVATERAEVATFCMTLALTGARISEVLALTPERIDIANAVIVLETLKQRTGGIFRAVPAPHALLRRLDSVHRISAVLSAPTQRNARLWPWGRTTAWSHVKRVMVRAGIELDGFFYSVPHKPIREQVDIRPLFHESVLIDYKTDSPTEEAIEARSIDNERFREGAVKARLRASAKGGRAGRGRKRR